MADIREKILGKFDINIDKINVLNLYKIDSADISQADLEAKIEACRKKWNQSINGANEKFAERDRAHLGRADKYEQILRDKKLRKELFAYYKKGTSSNENLSFAKEYFKMVEATKKIEKKDVDFFFKYYQNERKNKKLILEMLKTEFKIHGLGKEDKFAAEGEEVVTEGKKKNESSPLITNLFQEATIMKIHKCEQFLEQASRSDEVRDKYSKLNEELYDFLDVDVYKTIDDFSRDITKRREEAANYRLDRGQEYTPIVDLFNTLAEVVQYKDVVDNFTEFKLLLKYPRLSPYMYVFNEIKPNSLNSFYRIASTEYAFRDIYDFVLTYFKPIYDNFGILDKGISSILKKADQRAKANKVLNAVDDVLGLKKTKKIPFGATVVHYAVYWPIYLLYLAFETCKAIITELHRFAVPVFVLLFIGMNVIGASGDRSLLMFRHIFNKDKWLTIVSSFVGEVGNGFEMFIGSLVTILASLMIYILPPLLIALLIYFIAERFSQSVDWIGLERTFQEIFKTLRAKSEKQYSESKSLFFKKKIPTIFINILCTILLALIFHFVPIGLEWMGSTTGYSDLNFNSETQQEDTSNSEPIYMIIIANKANIRSGIGTSYDVVTVAANGTQFMWTGNQGTADNGGVWYEIYLDESMTQTGWASQSVIGFVEQ